MPSRRTAPLSGESRYRRRVLTVGGFAAFVLYVVGAPIYNNRIESDLERRVPEALAAAGFDGVDARFSGQEGSLSCARVLADPEEALRVAHDVSGVHSVRLDRECRVHVRSGDGETADATSADSDDAPGVEAGESAATSVPQFPTIAAALDTGRQFSAMTLLLEGSDLATDLADAGAGPFTLFAPTDDAFDALPAAITGRLDADAEIRRSVAAGHLVDGAWGPDELAGVTAVTSAAGHDLAVTVTAPGDGAAGIAIDGVALDEPIITPNGVIYPTAEVLLTGELAAASSPVTATLADGTLTLSGAVADQAAHDTLVFAGTAAVGGDRLANSLTIEDGGLDTAAAAELGSLIAALDAELVSGEASHDGDRLHLSGRYANDAAAARAHAAAADLAATIDIAPRPSASAEEAAALEAALNDYVRANPVQFEPNSAVLDPSAVAIIDRVAARLVEYANLTVEVGGHTDSDGRAANNQQLSEQRAGVVRQELITRGLDPAAITAVGYGSEQPVLVGGLEDKTASRRVEFRISTG